MRVQKRISVMEASQFIPQAGVWPQGVTPFAAEDSKTALMTCANCHHRMMQHGIVCVPNKGNIFLCPGDWILTDALGQQSTCKHDDFDREYEPVEKAKT